MTRARPSRLGPLSAAGLLLAAPALAATPPGSASPWQITWDTSTLGTAQAGGDIWPTTWAADGNIVTAWGDGQLGCPAKVAYGFKENTSALPGTSFGPPLSCGPGTTGGGKGKIGAVLAVGGTLYALLNLQNRPWPTLDHKIMRSTDGGRSWTVGSYTWSGLNGAIRPSGFVQRGQAVAAPDGSVRVLANRAVDAPTQVYLARVLPADLLGGTGWGWWTGTGWGSQANAVPILADPNGTDGPNASWDAGIGRFLLTTAHGGEAGGLGVFESASLTGPWSWIDYEDRWLGLGGEYLGYSFPIKWMGDGGRTLGTVFSCYGSATCTTTTGVSTHDRFAVITGTLSLRAAGGAAVPRDPGRGRGPTRASGRRHF